MKAEDIMTTHELCACAETSDAREVARMMAEHDVGAIPVLDTEGHLEGIITDRDVCCRLVGEGRNFETPVREIMSQPVQSVQQDADLDQIESTMRKYKIRRLPVVDSSGKLQGFISTADLLRACCGQKEEHEIMEVLGAICSPE